MLLLSVLFLCFVFAFCGFLLFLCRLLRFVLLVSVLFVYVSFFGLDFYVLFLLF